MKSGDNGNNKCILWGGCVGAPKETGRQFTTLQSMEPGSTKKENALNICFHKVLWVKGRTAGNYSIYEPNHIS